MLSTYQTELPVMINYTFNFNRALQSRPTPSLRAKPWQYKSVCKHQTYGAEILTKNANPLVTATTVPPPVLWLWKLESEATVDRGNRAKNSTAKPSFSFLPVQSNCQSERGENSYLSSISYHWSCCLDAVRELLTKRRCFNSPTLIQDPRPKPTRRRGRQGSRRRGSSLADVTFHSRTAWLLYTFKSEAYLRTHLLPENDQT